VTALAICLGLIVAMVAFTVNLVDALRPKVGDMIVFDAGGRHNDPARVDAPRWANGRAVGEVCAMDPAIIAANGGSLVIEARDPSGGEMEYRLHWAGAHSANGQGDCAGSADVAVSRVDLQRLANAAGGFGVQKRFVR